ncbi:MAG: hypothetical protein EXS38_02340 [Opitutus sp.]|nr:hypothetical protein [Opitutus sp.]
MNPPPSSRRPAPPAIRSRGWCLACAVGLALTGPARGKEELAFFAFDDVSIPFIRNLALEMQSPRKHPANPVVRRGPVGTPDDFGVQFYGSVLEEDGRFRMWYVAIDHELKEHPRSLQCWRPAYAESADGITWTKPALGLVPFHGSTANNLVDLGPSPLALINLKVLADPDDPAPDRRYKMTVHTWWDEEGERGRGTLGTLFSADGLRWRIATGAVPIRGLLRREDLLLPQHHFEAAGGLYKWDGIFYATGQSGPPTGQPADTPSGHGPGTYRGREVLLHRSRDFIAWEPTARVAFLREGQRPATAKYGEGEETHEGVSVWHRGNVLLGLYGLWHGGADWKQRTLDLGFLVSNDGMTFREPQPERAILRRGEDGEWDQGGLLQGQGFANVGEQTYIWYGAWDPRPGLAYPPRGGVGLAVLPRDRFAAFRVRNGAQSAELVTTKVRTRSSRPRLFLNVEGLGSEARVLVELLDARLGAIAGLAGADAAVVDRSGFRTPVLWKNPATSLPAEYCARLTFDGVARDRIRLCAIYLEP